MIHAETILFRNFFAGISKSAFGNVGIFKIILED